MPTNFTVVPVEDTPLSDPDRDGEGLNEEDKEEPETVAEHYSGESFLKKKSHVWTCVNIHFKQRSWTFKCLCFL